MKAAGGKTITLEIDQGSTVRSLTELVCDKEGLPADIVRLVYAGKQLKMASGCAEGDETGGRDTLLTDYNIQKECTIHLMIRNTVSQALQPITDKLPIQVKFPSATSTTGLDIDQGDKVWNVRQRLRLLVMRQSNSEFGLQHCDGCELRHKGLGCALGDEMTVTQAKITANTTLIIIPDTVHRGRPVSPKESRSSAPSTAAASVLTLQQAAELLGSESTRGQQLTDTAATANEYLEQMRQKAVMLRRFCVTEGSQPAEIDQMVRKSLHVLEGRVELHALQLAASEATEWQMKAHSEQVTARRLEQELSETEEALATNQQRLQQLEASIHHSRQAALAATASARALDGASEESDGVLPTKSSAHCTVTRGTDQQQVIADIRQEKMLDQDVPADMATAVASLRGMCGRALEKLSKDLYAHEGHFFHELLQNCDDNSYADSVTPTIKLGVTPDAIVLLNNELGFTEKDVRSICDLGASTKLDSSSIGRKGIGFKSVFMVSDSPHIISGDWSFRFDVKNHGLYGYVCPEWIDRTSVMKQLPVLAQKDLVDGNSQTCFWLPRDRAKAGQSNLQIQERLDPATLLFLRKIRRLVIEENGVRRQVWIEQPVKCEIDDHDGCLRVAQLYDVSESLVEEEPEPNSSAEPQLYFQYTRRLTVPPHLAQGTAELSIAFKKSDTFEPQNMFTFLPVCCSGFPFLLHATFELVSSRQAVRADSPYNLWLRDQIAPTFGMAMACDQLRERLPGLLSAFTVADPFWRPVVREIMKTIRGTACIQTESLRWVCPDKAILRPASVDTELASNSQLMSACNGLEFVSTSMNDMAEALGCGTFGLEQMVAIARQVFDNSAIVRKYCGPITAVTSLSPSDTSTADGTVLDGRHGYTLISDEMSSRVSFGWMRAFMTFLNSSVTQDDVGMIWDLKMFEIESSRQPQQHIPRRPLETVMEERDDQLVSSNNVVRISLKDGAIFASLPDEWRYVLHTNAVKVLSRDVMHHVHDDPACAKLLETCGIVVASPQAVARAIMEQHLSGTFVDEAACWHGLRFIRDHLSEICNAEASDSNQPLILQDLTSALCIPNLSHGVLMSPGRLSLRGVLGVSCPCCANIVKGQPGEQPVQLTRECLFVGSARASSSASASRQSTGTLLDEAKWDAFFVAIGVKLHSGCCTEPSVWTDCDEDQSCAICLESLPRSQVSSILPCSHRFHADCILKWTVATNQSSCPMCRANVGLDEIHEVSPDPIFTELSSALGGTLAMAYSSPSKTLIKAALGVMAIDSDTRSALGSVLVPTSMGFHSIRNCWDPSLQSNRGNKTAMQRLLPSIALPRMSAQSDPELTALLVKLGMCTTSTIDGLLHAAGVMRQQVIDGVNIGPTVILQAFASLYTAMHDMSLTEGADHSSLRRDFDERPIIFCGGSKFCCADEVVWNSNSSATVAQAVGTCTLQSLYGPSLEPFFVDTIGVKSVVGARAYWSALATLCDEYERDPGIASRAGYEAQLTEQVTLIYGQLEKLLIQGGSRAAEAETMAAAGDDRSVPTSAGICLLVRWQAPGAMRRITRVVRLSALTMPVFLNDDGYCYDIVADSIESWLVSAPFTAAPGLLRALCLRRTRLSEPDCLSIKRLSESIHEQGDVVIAEPISREPQWTMWARQFIESACAEYCRRPSAYALRLASTVTVLRSDSISSALSVAADGMQNVSNVRNYGIITDQGSGRIIMSSRRAHDAPAVCRCLARQLSGLLAEMHASCGETVFEWNAYAFLMRHCGLSPKPLVVLDSSNEHDRIDGFYSPSGSGGSRARIGGRPTMGTGPRFSFPASLPQPAELQVPPSLPLRTGQTWNPGGRNTNPTAITREGDAQELGTTDPTALLQQQVTALQAQLAQQQAILAASRDTIAALEVDRDAALSAADTANARAAATLGSPADATQAVGEGEWVCDYCTFINARPMALVCEVCEQQRILRGRPLQ